LLYEDSYRSARLVSDARGGNREAFDTLIQLHEARLRAFLHIRIGREAVEDVLQETRIAAYLALPKFHGKSRFKVWLFGIAHHKCADHHRARRAGDVSYEESGLEPPDPTDRYAATDLKLMVADLLKVLPPVQSEVLELYYFADLTLAEIAMVLGRSLNTVKAQFYRGHAAAAQSLPAELTAASGANRSIRTVEGASFP